MDYELFEELKQTVINIVEEKKNPKEVIKTLASLIDYVSDYLEDKNQEGE